MSDLERNYYDALNLTIAQHPSESLDRMVAKLLAFSINAQAGLAFTKGLSAVEEELNKLLAGLGQKIVKM